jgi:DNA-binding GntR family transcriptional regulator
MDQGSPRAPAAEGEADSGAGTSTLDRLRAAFRHVQGEAPLHGRLRAALLDLMASGYLGMGDKIPPERDIAEALGVSLGTAQKALARLADSNILVRRHGHGTFVAAGSQADQLLHFRFVGDDGVALVPVFAEALDRREVKAKGPWSRFLVDATSFIRVRRRINVGDEFDCLSEFYIDARRFRKILAMPFQELHRVRIRKVLAEHFNAPTLSVVQRAYATRFPAPVLAILKRGRTTRCGMVLDVFSFTHREQPVSFQRIYIPSDVRQLEIPSPHVKAS